MFSRTAEYALRAVIWLAGHADKPHAATQVAAAVQVPPGYMAKVLQALARTDVVTARRGLHGGFALGRSPDTISALDVVNAVDPIRRIRTCPLKLEAHGARLCALHHRLDSSIAGVERALADVTIAEIMGDPRPVHPLGDPACGGRCASMTRTKLSGDVG